MADRSDEPSAQVQSLILGGRESYTREEMASASRMDLDDVGRLWRAMGFPDVGEARGFTDADLTALVRVASLVERDVLGLEAVIDTARSMGQTTARLSEWQVDSLRRLLLTSGDAADSAAPEQETADAVGTGTDAEVLLDPTRVAETAAELLPELEELLVYVWRRQLAATVSRTLAQVGPEPVEGMSRGTVGFADLVSFTRLSRQLGEADLGRLVQTFETRSADVVHAHSARLVKTLGDEVMFIAEHAAQAAALAAELHAVHAADELVPDLRIGLATGDVLLRMGDVFGPTVNRASRLTALARPGTTVVDTPTSEAIQSQDRSDSLAVRALTPRPVRGLGMIRIYTVTKR